MAERRRQKKRIQVTSFNALKLAAVRSELVSVALAGSGLGSEASVSGGIFFRRLQRAADEAKCLLTWLALANGSTSAAVPR